MRHNKIILDSRQYVDKHLSKKDKEAKLKEIKEKKEERHYEWMAHVYLMIYLQIDDVKITD